MTATSSPTTPPDLWQFAIATYQRPGIAALCLQLQDDHACDVNLLLCCLWHGRYFGVITESRLGQALAWSEPWQGQVVAPLRAARRWLKQHDSDDRKGCSVTELRAQIKACELASERLQLEKLEAIVQPGDSGASGHAAADASSAQYRPALSTNLTRLGQLMQADSAAATGRQQIRSQLLEALVDCFCASEQGV